MTRRAFSLIEVLIAVVALALGLLGLAAVFPVVVTQQREASDRTLAVAAAKSIEAQLSVRTDLRDPVIGWEAFRQFVDEYDDEPSPSGWDDGDGGRVLSSTAASEWISPIIDDSSQFGEITWPKAANGEALPIRIPLEDRLVPAPGHGDTPRFVWDIVGRELLRSEYSGGFAPTGEVMVVIFLRRVDPAIRVREDENNDGKIDGDDVVEAFRAGLLSPVAVDSRGLATLNGRSPSGGFTYGMPEMLDTFAVVSFADPSDTNPDESDGLLIANPDDAQRSALSRVGQRLVDRHGNVFRVTAVKNTADGGLALRTDPGISEVVSTFADGQRGYRAADLGPLVYVPQSPVDDPIVMRIKR